MVDTGVTASTITSGGSDAAPPRPPTRKINSTGVLLGAQFGLAGLRFVSQVSLAWILRDQPQAFGILLLVNAVLITGELLTDLGFYPFVIRHERGEDPKTLDVLFTLQVARGLALTALVAALAPLLGTLLGKAEIVLPLQVASLLFVLKGFHSYGVPLARRQHQEWRNSLIEVGIGLGRIAVTIGIALAWQSHWALVIGILAGGVFELVASYVFYARPWRKLSWDRETVHEIWVFCRMILASGFISAFILQFDKFYVVGQVPLAMAGVYAVVGSIVLILDRFVFSYFNRIYFAKTAESVRTRGASVEGYYAPMRLMRPAFIFLFAAGAFAAPAIVDLLYPETFAAGGWILSILFLKPLFLAVAFPAQAYLISMKRMGAKFSGDVVRLVWLVIGVPAGFHFFGLAGLVWAVALQDAPRAVLYYGLLAKDGVVSLTREVTMAAAIILGALGGWVANLGYFAVVAALLSA